MHVTLGRSFFLFISVCLLMACQQKPAVQPPQLHSNASAPKQNSLTSTPPDSQLKKSPPPYILPSGPLTWSISSKIPLGGTEEGSNLAIELLSQKLYSSGGDEVIVIDLATKQILARLPVHASHGVVILPKDKIGLVSHGENNDVTIFSLDPLQIVAKAEAGKGPDALLHEPATDRVMVFNTVSDSACVIDPGQRKELGTIPLGGKPGAAVADGSGKVFVNLVDQEQVLTLDLNQFMLGSRWLLPPGSSPTALAIDPERKRIFLGCRNQKFVVINALTGSIVATLPTLSGVRAIVYDPLSQRIFIACDDGTLDVVHQDSADTYRLENRTSTKSGIQAMAFNPVTGRIYLTLTESPVVTAPAVSAASNSVPVTEILELEHRP